MGYKNKAYVIDENLVLSKAQALVGADIYSAVVNYGGNSLGYMKIVVKAHSDIVIPAEGTLTIVASYGNTSSPTDTLKKVLYTVSVAEGGDEITIPAGETICEEIISDSLPDNYKYVQLIYTTDADLSDGSVDAFVVMA